MQYKHWPKTGAILALGPFNGSLEESDAYHFAFQLLCENSPRSADLLKAHSHPDFYALKPLEEKENQIIKIDQVRDLIEWSQAKPQISTRKVALIYPAEALNLQASNALLKTLEEVPEDTLFILIAAESVCTLISTIVSRCYIVRSQTPDQDPNTVSDPLKDQVQKGLQSLDSNQVEPVALAALWHKLDIPRVLYWLWVVLHQKICLSLTGRGNIAGPEPEDVFHFLDKVYEAKRSLQEHGQLNTQLMLEVLLIQYSQVINQH